MLINNKTAVFFGCAFYYFVTKIIMFFRSGFGSVGEEILTVEYEVIKANKQLE